MKYRMKKYRIIGGEDNGRIVKVYNSGKNYWYHIGDWNNQGSPTFPDLKTTLFAIRFMRHAKLKLISDWVEKKG